MKKIGFIDYYLSEWHANKYPGWMADICNAEGLEYQIAYAWGEMPSGASRTAWSSVLPLRRFAKRAT